MADLSIARGPTDVPLLDQTIGAALRAIAARLPDGLALVSRHQGLRWTWRGFDAEVDRIATGLAAQGVVPGDRVGIWAPNCAEWTLLQFASARIGAILVTINPAYRAGEVAFALRKVGCSVLVTACRFKTSDYLAMLAEIPAYDVPDLRLIVTLHRTDIETPPTTAHPEPVEGCAPPLAQPSARVLRQAQDERSGEAGLPAPKLGWHALVCEPDRAALARIEAALSPDDPINIQFTSGTTGLPKGATLSHRNILNNGYFTARTLKYTADDRICVPVPLYHCFGMVLGNLAAVTSGAALVYPADSFDPQAVFDAIGAERCTALYGVPTMFISLLNHPALADARIETLRTGIMAGSPCPLATMRAVMAQLNMGEVTIGYGMTETSPLTTQTATDDPVDARVGTVGRVHPHAEAKIVGPDGETVPIGVAGEYCARGYAVMQGYWDEPGLTAQAIDAEGWMHSGDLATMDQAGYVRITGRIKDTIIRGGENIAPREIEEFLLDHPDIADAQVFGVSDARLGEEVCAWIIARPGTALCAEDVLAHCRGRIAHYKVPRHIRLVSAFAMTVTGKAQKFAMRQIMEAELAAG